MEGCRTIFGGDKDKERLGEICPIEPVRTGWKKQIGGKRNDYPNGKWIRKLNMTGRLLLENLKKTSVWSHPAQTPKIVISLGD